jgi:hypothetical protein
VFSYTGTITGSDVITAAGVISGFGVTSSPVTKEWIDPAIGLTPATAQQIINTPTCHRCCYHKWRAHRGGSAADVYHHQRAKCRANRRGVTDAGSQATFSYTSTLIGTDTISVQTVISGQMVSAAATITWRAEASVEPVYLPIILKSPPTFEVPD